jgi:hypothetical protein
MFRFILNTYLSLKITPYLFDIPKKRFLANMLKANCWLFGWWLWAASCWLLDYGELKLSAFIYM